jgi:non-lysosomal glucosylceramidase
MSDIQRQDEFAGALEHGFVVRGKGAWRPYRSKPGSCDDGPEHGPFMGGIGCGSFSRDLSGAFSRWHMQPGYHVRQTIPQARFLVYWTRQSGARGCRYVGVGKPAGWDDYRPSFSGFDERSRTYAALFPDCYEYYEEKSLPCRLLVHAWSPLIFGSVEAALPVVVYSLSIENSSQQAITAAAAFFWPNILGWRQSRVTAVDRGDAAWPGQTHAGNTNRAARIPWDDFRGAAVVQTRLPHIPARRDMEGEVLLAVQPPAGGGCSAEICFKSDQNALGVAPASQMYTQAWVEEHFAASGVLPQSGKTWQAHWHEPLSSAVAGSASLGPGEQGEFVFLQVFDLPLTVFGSERVWTKKYTGVFGEEGDNSEAIAAHAFENIPRWREALQEQKRAFIQNSRSDAARLKGGLLNELFFLTAGGSAWTGGMKPAAGLDSPALGAGEHFALLEGYDTGYYYYNTFDLWIYAFPAIASTWPELARGVFDDYLKSLDAAKPRKRIVYRVMEEREMLSDGKIPHDIGTPMEDPWNELNGYTMRDDPNRWRDHNPALICGYYLFSSRTGSEPRPWQWEALKKAARYMLAHDSDGDGLPEHLEFGDSTWDALKLEGTAAFSGGLTLAAYAALIAWAEHFRDGETQRLYADRLKTGLDSYESKLWTGSYYRTASRGAYGECIMIDTLLGPFYADLAGLGPLLPRQRIVSHLAAAYEANVSRYAEGRVGPLLVASARNERLTPDGGEELQINEVLVGAAWSYCAMLFRYGLHEQAEKIAEALLRVLYAESGLQFRTPAAWDAEGLFRAPFNMRPLAIWLLEWV